MYSDENIVFLLTLKHFFTIQIHVGICSGPTQDLLQKCNCNRLSYTVDIRSSRLRSYKAMLLNDIKTSVLEMIMSLIEIACKVA